MYADITLHDGHIKTTVYGKLKFPLEINKTLIDSIYHCVRLETTPGNHKIKQTFMSYRKGNINIRDSELRGLDVQ
jgi:hypothetical protein